MEGFMTHMMQRLQRMQDQRGKKKKKLGAKLEEPRATEPFSVEPLEGTARAEEFLEIHLVMNEESSTGNVHKRENISQTAHWW